MCLNMLVVLLVYLDYVQSLSLETGVVVNLKYLSPLLISRLHFQKAYYSNINDEASSSAGHMNHAGIFASILPLPLPPP
jgi:hypothetical protein